MNVSTLGEEFLCYLRMTTAESAPVKSTRQQQEQQAAAEAIMRSCLPISTLCMYGYEF